MFCSNKGAPNKTLLIAWAWSQMAARKLKRKSEEFYRSIEVEGGHKKKRKEEEHVSTCSKHFATMHYVLYRLQIMTNKYYIILKVIKL